MPDQQIIKRLSIIKYLYKIGIDQSYQVEPLGAYAILSFHDSIEMFLKLIAEIQNINSRQFKFMDYWNALPKLTLQESMKALNTRRVNIKHHGLLPSKADIEASRVNVTDFFEQNTPLYFDINFNEISLFSLINNVEIRNKLEESQTALSMKKYDESIECTAIAFSHLLYVYENNKYIDFYPSPFDFGDNLAEFSTYTSGIDPKLDKTLKQMAESISALQSAMKITSLGIDYKRYTKFRLLTPSVTRTIGGKYIAQIWNEKQWTIENCQYCIDFVLDACLKLQEFDFDIRDIETPNVLKYHTRDFEIERIQMLSSTDLVIK